MAGPIDQRHHILTGVRNARHHLTTTRKSVGAATTKAYAAGLAQGIQQYLSERYTPQEVYHLFSSLADDALKPILPETKE